MTSAIIYDNNRSNYKSLLPTSASIFEQALEAAVYRATNLDVSINRLWDYCDETLPSELLTYLAWGLGVEIWGDDSVLPPAKKRRLIADYLQIRFIRGTYGAIKKAFLALGLDVDIVELKDSPFRFMLKISGEIVDKDLEISVKKLINLLKPLRTKYAVDISIKYSATVGVCAVGRISSILKGNIAL